MTWFDIVVIAVAIYCLWGGWCNGILVELSGIIGIVLGTWVSYHFCESIALRVGIEVDRMPYWVLFTVVLLGVMVIVVALSHLVTRLFKAGGLAMPLRLLGMLFALVKGALLLSLMLFLVESFGNIGGSVELPDEVRNAKSYPIICRVSDFTFPYLQTAKEMASEVIDKI